MQELDLLILGAGWTSTFLIPLLQHHRLSFAATTRDGRDVAGSSTIKWNFDPNEEPSAWSLTALPPKNQFSSLPLAKTILTTFPLTTAAQTNLLTHNYRCSHPQLPSPHFIQLGSTGIWQIPNQKTLWLSRRSPYNTESPRAIAEDELMKQGGCVLNLAGLWGGSRDPKTWVERVAKTKEEVKGKQSLHMVHGADVARAVVGVMRLDEAGWEKLGKGQRWMVTDGFVYDWWSLMAGWADVGGGKEGDGDGEGSGREPSPQAKWVYELMKEEKIWALPRSMNALGRCYYGREFWDAFGMVPLKGRI